MHILHDYLPQWMFYKQFGLMNLQWLGLLLTTLISLLIEKIVRILVRQKLIRILPKLHIHVTEKSKKQITLPIGLFTFSLTWLGGLYVLALPKVFFEALAKAAEVTFLLGVITTIYGLVDLFCAYLQKKADETENKLDDVIVPLVRKTLKFFVVAVGIITIGDALTLDMKGLIAGLGIGGLAFAFAAKDTIGNFFGSLTVILDHPFTIGDWVIIDNKVEGTIIEVGMRSTRIKTFYDSIITLPNGMLTNVQIDNMGKRQYRRFSTKIGVQYDTPPEKIDQFCQGIREIILSHPYTRKDYFHVYFNGMGNFSLDILLYVFWEVAEWSQELQEKHKLLLEIVKLGHSMGVEFAFPTQTLHLKGLEASQNISEIPV